jgi:hypothetical protein
VRWFGRNDDDPNRLLIIEDEHSRVFLDADLRQELYSVIESSRPHTRAPTEPDCCNPCPSKTANRNCRKTCRIFTTIGDAARAATLAENKRVLDVLATLYTGIPERFLEGTYRLHSEWKEKIESLRQSTTAGDEPK